MMPTTPKGTRIRPTWMPVGRYLRSLISPTGSGSAAICRRPSAIAATVAGFKVRRSTNAASLPVARAPATSWALAARSFASSRRIAAAIASSAESLACVDARARTRAAARARSPTSRMYTERSRPGTLKLLTPHCNANGGRYRSCSPSELVRVQSFYTVVGAHQDHVGTAPREQTVGDDADDVVDLRLELGGIQDAQILDVEDDVAVVGREMLAQLRMAAEPDELVRDGAPRHRNDLDRQRVAAEHADQLRLIDDAHETLRHGRDDLLPGQRAAAALDHRAVRGGFVGAVDVDGEHVDAGQLDHRNAVTLEPVRGMDRAGDRALDPVLDLCELIDEVIGGGAGADAEVGIVDDELDCVARDESLLFVLGHVFFRTGGRSVHTPSKTSAAKPTDSESVGCGWIVLPMSTASAPISIASAISLIRSPARVPTMPPPTTRCVASSNRSLVKPSSRPLAIARPDAAQGNTLFCTLTPFALASSSVIPTHAISGSVY